MDLEEALYAKLLLVTGVTDLVGDRIYPEQGDQSEELPQIVYSQTHRKQIKTIAGDLLNTSGAAMRWECYAETYREAKAVYQALRTALFGNSSTCKGNLGGGIFVQTITEETGGDESEPPVHGTGTGIFVGNLDISIRYDEN